MTQMDKLAGLILMSGGLTDLLDDVNTTIGDVEVEAVHCYGDNSTHIRLLNGLEQVANRYGADIDHWGRMDSIYVMGINITQYRKGDKDEPETV